jgi:3-hydroxyacyl-CoA dehydrogenase
MVALIRVDNPPVNAISHRVRVELAAALARAHRNSEIKVVLMLSSGGMFSAGGDIKEFDGEMAEPTLQQLQTTLELSPLPVVAAIHGLALGGGLELAMACHYRLAQADARLGLPEITLGLIPGAGGTQRLPRLIGARAALDMILSGVPISASDAKARGLVDEVVEGELPGAALNFCERLVHRGLGPRPTCTRTLSNGLTESDVADALQAHARTVQGRTTPGLLIDAIKAATLPFSAGMAVEAALARKSVAARESQALRYLFFAERETGRRAGLPPGTTNRPDPERLAVIGAGTMGTGIAIALADAGLGVMLIDNSAPALSRSREVIESTYASAIQRGRIDSETAAERAKRIRSTMSIADAAGAQMVIEAVFEDIELKKAVLSQLESLLSPESPIATNTSTLSVTELARSTAHPCRVFGLHFFVPAHVSKLLEIVRTDHTSPEAMATALRVAKRLKKTPVVSRDAFGFIGNRMMLDGYFREAEQLMLEGASPTQVDVALETFGFAMGPQRVSDLGGNDVGTKARQQLFRRESRPDPYFVIADRLTELGRLGQKTGRGFYRYASGSREPLPDPVVINLIEQLASARGLARRKIADEEIVERCLLALVNVGAMVLEEGIAAGAADIDVVWTSGYGFPRHLGGPMFYADTLGLPKVAQRIHHYQERLGHYWRPSALIDRLAEANSCFRDWDDATSGSRKPVPRMR